MRSLHLAWGVFGYIIATGAHAWSAHAGAGLRDAVGEQRCAPVPLIEQSGGHGASIRGIGAWCLERDVRQKPVFDIHAGGFKSQRGAPLLNISCPKPGPCPGSDSGIHYDIDLQGHTLAGEADGMTGVANLSGGLGIRLRNGVIAVRGRSSMGVFLYGGRLPVEGAYSPEAARRAPWMVTAYTIEHLAIRAGGQGVNISGRGNVLRNSVIEVDGHTAAYLFGPDSIVENNTFIVHERGSGHRRAQQAALQLREADRAVVRNNRFVFKGGWLRRGDVAFSLVDSAGVTVEGNTFEGFEQQQLLDGSTMAAPPRP